MCMRKRIGGPTTLLSDFIAVNIVEVHRHGAPRTEGVAADCLWWKTMTAVLIILLMSPAGNERAELVRSE